MLKTPLVPLLGALLLLASACGGGGDGPAATQDGAASTPLVQPAASATLPAQPSPISSPGVATPSPSPRATAPASQQTASVTTELEAAVSAFASVRSFRASLRLEVAGQAPQTGTLEFARPDRVRLTLSGGPAGAGGLVIIGQDGYVSIGGVWSKLPASATQDAFDVSALTAELGDVSLLTNPQRVGSDRVNGRNCQVYVSKHTAVGETEYCVAEGRLWRLIQRQGDVSITLVFEEYDGNVDIRPPL